MSWRFGVEEAARAGAAEFALFAVMAGFTGALTQRVRNLRPVWAASLIVLVVIPLCLHSVEWLAHTALGSVAKGRGVALSLAMTVVAELFNWYVMRQGAMLAGREGAPFVADVKRIPALIGGFLCGVAGASLVRKSIRQIADERQAHEVDTFLDLLIDHGRALRWTTLIANHNPDRFG